MSKSKEILTDELLKLDPTWSGDEIRQMIDEQPILTAADNAIKRHAKELLNELAETNQALKKAFEELE